MDCIEIDDDSPLKPPPERALWCAVLASFVEDIDACIKELTVDHTMLRAVAISHLDSIIDELVSPWTETMCDFANVPHDDFVDGLLEKVKGIQ